MYHGPTLFSWESLLREGIREDGWPWDWTSLGTERGGGARRKLGARIIAKSDGVWAAGLLLKALVRVSPELGFEAGLARDLRAGEPSFQVLSKAKDGEAFRAGQVLCRWKGPARVVLALERPFLNLAAYACGIATQTSQLVALVRRACPSRPPRVVPTRKTLPGYRDLAVHAIRAGGGFPHRLNLAGGVLIKENHVAAAGGIAKAIAGAREAAPHGLKIEVEVRNLRELGIALGAGAEAVLVDNFSPEDVKRAVALVERHQPRPVLEVSGGIHAGNIARYAVKGVDVISIGSLTLSVQAVDLSCLVDGVR